MKRKVKFAVWGVQRPETGFLAPLISLLSARFVVRRDLKGEGSILASPSPTGHAQACVQTLRDYPAGIWFLRSRSSARPTLILSPKGTWQRRRS